MSIIAPLPKGLSTILQEECNTQVGFYAGKSATLDAERKVAKAYIDSLDIASLAAMIKHAVYQTYIGRRTIYTLSLLLSSIMNCAFTPSARSVARSCVLDTLRNQENHHYNNNNKVDSEKQQQRHATLVSMINTALIDCATYFRSETLEKLNIIPCQARFDRRCQLLVTPTKTQQYGSNTNVNRIIHHYILATMEIDNEDHGYATIPFTKVDEFENLFRSYLCGEYMVDGIVLMDIMLDLFMDEVHYNYSFWLELIRRCSDMTKSSPSTCNTNSLITSKELLHHGDSPPSILSSLFYVKLNHLYSNLDGIASSKGMKLYALNYCVALLSRAELVTLDILLAQCAGTDYEDWKKQLVMALFSLGSCDQALGVIEGYNLDIASDDTFCSWMQDMMIAFIESWMKMKPITSNVIRTANTSKIKPTGRSPLRQVMLPDDDIDDHLEEVTATTTTTTAATTTSATAHNVDCGNNEHNDSSFNFFHHQSAFPLAQYSPIQFLKQFLIPCMLNLGGVRMSVAPTTMNTILSVIERALDEDRPYVVYVCTTFIFPVLAYQPLSRLWDLFKRLTTEERLAIYLAWRTKDDDWTLRVYRNHAMADLKALLNDTSTRKKEQHTKLESTLASMALNHPIDIADVILDHIESPENRFAKATGNFESRRILAKVLYQPNHTLALDAMAALLAYRLAIFDAGNMTTTSNAPSGNINALHQFAKYILANDHPVCESLYCYLDAFQQQSSTPLQSVTLLRFICTKYLTQYEPSHPTVLSPLLSPTLLPSNASRKRKPALETPLLFNKKQRTLD